MLQESYSNKGTMRKKSKSIKKSPPPLYIVESITSLVISFLLLVDLPL